jgi:outer membrane lipoprotein SlyB
MNAGALRARIRPVAVTGSVLAVGVASITALGGWLTGVRAQSLADPGAQSAHVATRDAADPSKAACATCGVVAAVRTFEVRGDSAGAGEAQRPAGARTSYRVTVRMLDGSYRTLAQPTPPSVGVGDRVRIAAGAVVREN